MKKRIAGILAHVDAGKTTLSEALLYKAGKIKKLGRVDHRNTYLDTHQLERERGITIFSKQAVIETADMALTLLDTPGHVDFSAETERTLAVLDCAILVISGTDGVQAHTETLWQLLHRYRVPTFIFVTKMDVATSDKNAVMADLTAHLSSGCVDFSATEGLAEAIALCEEETFETYMETGTVEEPTVRRLIRERKLFPCCFGSGLKLEGVEDLLDLISRYTEDKAWGEEFSARVYKIGRDASGNRLTYLKVTGGALETRQSVSYTPAGGDEAVEEKITAIRRYSGAKYETADRIEAGDVCAVTGLSATYAGQGLGGEEGVTQPYLEPVLHYRIKLPKGAHAPTLLTKFKELEEEEPLLHVLWNERFGEIHAQVMGQVQTEVLVALIQDRFGVEVTFDEGRILYKETLKGPQRGAGHYEPLRHYAEVHLLLRPLERGAGLVFDSAVEEHDLDRNWQRLILTHLEEKQHLGCLTGSPITDMQITLVAGRAHLKHTEGGDFRQATYRAVRQGLMEAVAKGNGLLLEPYYDFRLEIPAEAMGRAISDLVARYGSYEEQSSTPETVVLRGKAPVATMSDYGKEVASYTHGRGRFSCHVAGYFPCHNQEEVVASSLYDPEADLSNSPDSVFCARGAGFVVPWYQVGEYMHLSPAEEKEREDEIPLTTPRLNERNVKIDEKELEAIMEREFGPIRRPVYGQNKSNVIVDVKAPKYKKALYIVDGYNVIFAWEELKALADEDLERARRALCDVLANYKAFTGRDIILVFDAYNVKGARERKLDYNGVNVVYTKEGELGDTYIDRLVSKIGKDYNVRVITSDGLIQLQALRSGVLRLSAREFYEEINAVDEEIGRVMERLRQGRSQPL